MKFTFLWVLFSHLLFGIGVSFVDTGTPPVPPVITSSPKLKIYKGWNLLAPPSNFPFSTSAIKNIIGSNVYIFNSNNQSWSNGLNTEIEPGVGFWVNVSASSSVEYRPSIQNSFPISAFKVSKGWNLLGMSADSERINIVSISHDAKRIVIYNAKEGTWREFASYSRDSLKAGMGFWLETN